MPREAHITLALYNVRIPTRFAKGLGIRDVYVKLIHRVDEGNVINKNKSSTRLRADSFQLDSTRLVQRSLILLSEPSHLQTILFKLYSHFTTVFCLRNDERSLRRLQESLAAHSGLSEQRETLT